MIKRLLSLLLCLALLPGFAAAESVEDALDELRNPARFDQSVVEQLAAVLETAEGLKAMKV